MEFVRARAVEHDAATAPRAEPATTGLVVVVPSDSAASVSPGTIIAGLPLLRRIVLAAERADSGWVVVLAPDVPEARRLLEGTRAIVLAPNEPLPHLPPSRVVVLPVNVIPQSQWLRALFAVPIEPERLHVKVSSMGVIDANDPRAILAKRAHGQTVPLTFDQQGRFVLTSLQECRRAEDWLLRGLIKETDGFMSRHVERRISLAISRWLAPTRITPNAMTLISVGVGLLGAPFFLSSLAGYQFTGALLFLLHSILDGCDGELARLKFMESRWGGILDFWGDNLVHVAVFLCLAIGWSVAAQAAWPLILGGTAVAGTVLSAGFIYRYTMRARTKGGPLFTSVSRSKDFWLSRMADALAGRDFIYVVVLLAAAGKATWFLALAGVGAPIFFLVLLWVAFLETRREESVT